MIDLWIGEKNQNIWGIEIGVRGGYERVSGKASIHVIRLCQYMMAIKDLI